MKTLSSKNDVMMTFGEWYQTTFGNTYYDVLITIDDESYMVKHQYGYNAGDTQSIDEALAEIGYKVRKNTKDKWNSYRHISINKIDKLKRELFTETTILEGGY